jgi:CRISPR/Cas system-associated endonuclease Cas3-HD
MKAILEFNLPEDQTEYQMVNDASKMLNVIWDMKQWLRSQTKYAAANMSDDTYKAFEECREKLNELMNENNIEL